MTFIRNVITTSSGLVFLISNVDSSPVFLFLLIWTLNCFTSEMSCIQQLTKHSWDIKRSNAKDVAFFFVKIQIKSKAVTN